MNARSSDDRAERAQGAGPSWPDFLRQAGIWVAFLLVYQAARGAAGGDAAEATRNARVLVRAEQALGTFFEPALQREALETGGALVDAANWTYWLSQFAVVSLALVWIYLFRHPAFVRVRNTIILANVLGLAGYVAHPTAPPRLCRIRTSSTRSRARRRLNHGSAIVELVSNPYAAMPSLHAADALVVGVSIAVLVRSGWLKLLWAAWPAWVAFTLIVTANHFWLDIAAGAAVAGLAGALVLWGHTVALRRSTRPPAAKPKPIRDFQPMARRGRGRKLASRPTRGDRKSWSRRNRQQRRLR